MSGRGVGKTAVAAMATLWWLGTRRPALVVCSAGSWSHLTDKLWPEVLAWGQQWRMRELFEFQETGIYSNIHPRTWRVETSSSNDPNKVEGFHSPNMLLIIDEAKGMPDEIYSALVASLSGKKSTGEQKALVLSTPPTSDVGWFAKACSNERWHTVHISGLDSERVSKEFVEDIRDTFGEESNEYKAYVLGVIPGGVTGQLIHTAWFEAAQQLGEDEDDRRPAVITCDVAREGDDLAVIGCLKKRKFNLVQFEDRWGWWSTCSTTTLARRLARAAKDEEAAYIVVDDTGVGGGVTDMLRLMQAEHDKDMPPGVTIVPVNFAQAARRPDRFHLRKDELWWELREAIKIDEKQEAPRLALPTDKEIARWKTPKKSDFKTQLLQTIYESQMDETVRVYDKRLKGVEKTKVLPTKSADLAHALIVGVEIYLGQEPLPMIVQPPSNQEQAMQQLLKQQLEAITRRPVPNPYLRR